MTTETPLKRKLVTLLNGPEHLHGKLAYVWAKEPVTWFPTVAIGKIRRLDGYSVSPQSDGVYVWVGSKT